MAMPAPVMAGPTLRPVPHLRLVKATLRSQEHVTASIFGKVLLLGALVFVAVGLVLVVAAIGEKDTDPEQAWFWEPDWLAGELGAQAEIAAGEGQAFDSDEAFLDHLDQVNAKL